MELEQLSFGEALRYLANKYNIEIPETELTEEEQQAENDRGAMFAVNEFAAKHFAHNLLDTDDGRAIGLSYFKQRGISERMIKRFGLGYALENRNDLYMTALRRGFNERYLVDTGLCIRNERGDVYDRFKGRVIYLCRQYPARLSLSEDVHCVLIRTWPNMSIRLRVLSTRKICSYTALPGQTSHSQAQQVHIGGRLHGCHIHAPERHRKRSGFIRHSLTEGRYV